MNDLTESQEQCLLIVDRYTKENGEPPTRRELAKLIRQKSTNGVNQILGALQKKGYLKLDPPRRKRNIMVLRKSLKQLTLFGDNGEG